MDNFTLTNGITIPQLGFGTYLAANDESDQNIYDALMLGYRHLDTAAFYMNEHLIKTAVARSGIKRDELFITSKIWKTNLGYRSAYQAFEASCERLGTDYLDLYLIHWPKNDFTGDAWVEQDRQTWKAMEELYKAGRIRAIGVSNFLPQHLKSLMQTAVVMPMVNQLEFHPGYIQNVAVNYCQKKGIQVEAWSPIGRARIMKEPFLIKMAEQYGRSVPQLCIRFALQCGVLPLPKSSSIERMRQNLEVFDFEISEYDMDRLLTLPQKGWSGEHPDFETECF